VATRQKRTARVKPPSSVNRADYRWTLISMPRSISLGLRSWSLLQQDAP